MTYLEANQVTNKLRALALANGREPLMLQLGPDVVEAVHRYLADHGHMNFQMDTTGMFNGFPYALMQHPGIALFTTPAHAAIP